MPPKQKTTKAKKAKRDIFDFFTDASKRRSAIGACFLSEMNRKGVKAEDIYRLLKDWGYEGVRLEQVTTMFKLYKKKLEFKNAAMTTGY